MCTSATPAAALRTMELDVPGAFYRNLVYHSGVGDRMKC